MGNRNKAYPDKALRARKILISAGEASGDGYAAMLVEELRRSWPEAEFFGCAGPRMRAAGVRAVIRSESLSVVGLVEVLRHIPRIWGEYRKLLRAIRAERPSLAILTDSPDFHLRVARKVAAMGIPVVYLVAPQVWAWRKDRLPMMRRVLTRLLCIFPFEEKFFRERGVDARYIGHPLSNRIRPSCTREEFLTRHGIEAGRPLVGLLPGSRRGEAARHIPELLDAAAWLARECNAVFVLPASPTTGADFFSELIFKERNPAVSIHIIEGQAWDVLSHADMCLAASGTVTVEGAMLGAPMVTFYKVTDVSWLIGKFLVKVPFYCMVNLIAEREVVPELMQEKMTGANLARAAARLLTDPVARETMKRDLREVSVRLASGGDAIARAAEEICSLEGDRVRAN